jgi:hypothetical protein
MELEVSEVKPKMCGYAGLGLTGDLSHLPTDRAFGARCTCGAHVTVVDGRIPFHFAGVDERPPDEACEPK